MPNSGLVTEAQELLERMYRADRVATAVDAVRRGFELTDEEREQLIADGFDPEAIEQEFGDEFTV